MTRATRVELFVEEPSAAAALRILVPKIRGDLEYRIYEFQGCHDLLTKLPDRLRGFARSLPAESRLIVLIDRDRHDCVGLKKKILAIGQKAGLRCEARPGSPAQLFVRIAVEELEAWFFGDVPALRRAYRGIPETLARKAAYRTPDAIKNTWEQLQKVLQQAGHFPGGLEKIRCAREVAAHMDPASNLSHSFRVFRDSLLRL